MKLKIYLGIASLLITLTPQTAWGCLPLSELPPSVDPSSHRHPSAPAVELTRVTRGTDTAHGTAGSCSGGGLFGFIIFSIPSTFESRKLLYRFELVAGEVRDHTGELRNDMFQTTPQIGVEEDGKLFFTFTWNDGATFKQEPLNLIVRVTAIRQSGLSGDSIDVIVRDPGR
jgi:hypothetical protein